MESCWRENVRERDEISKKEQNLQTRKLLFFWQWNRKENRKKVIFLKWWDWNLMKLVGVACIAARVLIEMCVCVSVCVCSLHTEISGVFGDCFRHDPVIIALFMLDRVVCDRCLGIQRWQPGHHPALCHFFDANVAWLSGQWAGWCCRHCRW